MTRSDLPSKRIVALAIVIAVLAVSGVAYGLSRTDDGGSQEAATESTTSTADDTSSTSTTEAPTTTDTTAPETTTTTGPDGILERGEHGEEVAALQRRLIELKLDPGPPDGAFGTGTLYAVQGFQKL